MESFGGPIWLPKLRSIFSRVFENFQAADSSISHARWYRFPKIATGNGTILVSLPTFYAGHRWYMCHALLGIIQPSVQMLRRSLRRLSARHPSFPQVVAGVVLCGWRPTDSGPLLDSLAGWHYDAGDHGRLHRGRKPPSPLQPSYAVGLQCSSYGRLSAAGVSEPGAVPVGQLQGTQCEPRPQNQAPPRSRPGTRFAFRMTPQSTCSAAPLTWAASVSSHPIAAASDRTLGKSRASSRRWPMRSPTSPACKRRARCLPPHGQLACRTACARGPPSGGGGGGWSP